MKFYKTRNYLQCKWTAYRAFLPGQNTLLLAPVSPIDTHSDNNRAVMQSAGL